MADEDILIKNLPTTESVNDDDDIVIEDAAPTTYRIKAGDLRSYITSEVARQIEELEETKADQTDVEQNAKDIATNASAIDELNQSLTSQGEEISEINQSLTDYLKVQSFTSEAYSVSASSNVTASIDISLDGYTPLGIVTWTNDGSGTSNLNVYGITMNSAKTTISYAVRNIGSSIVSSFAAKITVLYMKNI